MRKRFGIGRRIIDAGCDLKGGSTEFGPLRAKADIDFLGGLQVVGRKGGAHHEQGSDPAVIEFRQDEIGIGFDPGLARQP